MTSLIKHCSDSLLTQDAFGAFGSSSKSIMPNPPSSVFPIYIGPYLAIVLFKYWIFSLEIISLIFYVIKKSKQNKYLNYYQYVYPLFQNIFNLFPFSQF